MQSYFANFIKTGNPNSSGLPEWPAVNAESTPRVMHLDVTPGAEPENDRAQHLFLDKIYAPER